MFQGNKAPQISRKNEHFLPPDTHTYVSLPLFVITDEMSDIMSVYGKTFFPGVPRGYILSPLMFNIYTKDIFLLLIMDD